MKSVISLTTFLILICMSFEGEPKMGNYTTSVVLVNKGPIEGIICVSAGEERPPKQKKQQKGYAILDFLVGIAGIVVGLFLMAKLGFGYGRKKL